MRFHFYAMGGGRTVTEGVRHVIKLLHLKIRRMRGLWLPEVTNISIDIT